MGVSQFTVHVLATTADGTRAALRAAARHSADLNAKIVLLIPQIVSPSARIDDGYGAASASGERFRPLAQELESDVDVTVALCRSSDDIARLLSGTSLVLVGGRRLLPWWPCQAERLTRRIARMGCPALFVPEPGGSPSRLDGIGAPSGDVLEMKL